MHVVLFACIPLKAVGYGQIFQFAFVGGYVLPALFDLPLQVSCLPVALHLFDYALVTDKQEEDAEDQRRYGVLVDHPSVEPRVLLNVLAYVRQFLLQIAFNRLIRMHQIVPAIGENRHWERGVTFASAKVQKLFDICKFL